MWISRSIFCHRPNVCHNALVKRVYNLAKQLRILAIYQRRIRHAIPSILVYMITSSNGNIFCVTSPLWRKPSITGGFPSQRPVTQPFDVFFHLRLNKRLSKQLRRRWFETLSSPLWRHRTEPQKDWNRIHRFLDARMVYAIYYNNDSYKHR